MNESRHLDSQSPTQAGEGLFRPGPQLRFPIGNGRELVRFPLSDSTINAASRDLNLLTACLGFASVPEHARRLAAAFPFESGQAEMALVLKQLQAAGALISQDELLGACRSSKRDRSGPYQIDWLAIPTGSRPRELARALQSYIANQQQFGRQLRYCVMADEDDLSRPALEREARAHNVAIYYAGPKEKASYARILCSEGDLPLETVAFGLLGSSDSRATVRTGANRNAILLQTLGDRILSVDDDTVCRTGRASTECKSPHPSFVCGGDYYEYWCSRDIEASVSNVVPVLLDPFAEHEQFLSRTVGELAWTSWESGSGDLLQMLDNICGHTTEAIFRRKGTVRVTYNGSVGDSGFRSDIGILTSSNP